MGPADEQHFGPVLLRTGRALLAECADAPWRGSCRRQRQQATSPLRVSTHLRGISSTANHIFSPSLQFFVTGLFTGLLLRRICWSGNVQDYKEIDRIRKDSVAVKSLARKLLSIPN